MLHRCKETGTWEKFSGKLIQYIRKGKVDWPVEIPVSPSGHEVVFCPYCGEDLQEEARSREP